MKYKPINNSPRLSLKDGDSISPSFCMDDRGFTHVSYLRKELQQNVVSYVYWDGNKWSYKTIPDVYLSDENIIHTPNSLALDSDENPYIAFSRKGATNSIISLANYYKEWHINDLSVDYVADWVGITRYDRGLEYSSSFSSSSSSYSSSSSTQIRSSSSSTQIRSSSSSSSSSSTQVKSSSSSSYFVNFSSSSTSMLSSSSSSFSSSSRTSSSSLSSSSSSVSSVSSISSSSSSSLSSLSSSSTQIRSTSSSSDSSSSSLYSRSSSSSSSFDDAVFFVTVHDATNNRFKIYAVTDATWRLLGNIELDVLDVTDLSSIRLSICGRKNGIGYIKNGVIKYNFFDLDYLIWSFSSFQNLIYSQSYGTVLDMDMDGYNQEDIGVISFAWLSRTSTNFYVQSVYVNDYGIEIPSDNISSIIKSTSINVYTSSDYIINGYRKITVCLDTSNLPNIFAMGLNTSLFTMNLGIWDDDFVDIDGRADGFKPSLLRSYYYDDMKVVIESDNGIYYFEPSTDEDFPITTPDLAILTNHEILHATFADEHISGVEINGTDYNQYGDLLRDSERPIVVAMDKWTKTLKQSDLENDTVISTRNVTNDKEIKSINIEQGLGKYIVSEPEDNAVVIYPQSPQLGDYPTTLNDFGLYGTLDYPLDARFDYTRSKIWIVDTSNERILKVNRNTGVAEAQYTGIIYSHSIAINLNNGGVFVKGYTNKSKTSGIIYYFNIDAVLLETFIFDADVEDNSSSTSSMSFISTSTSVSNSSMSSSSEVIPILPHPHSMMFNHVTSRLWWVEANKVYMIDERNKQASMFTLSDYTNTYALDIEWSTGNVIILASKSNNDRFLIEMNRDNTEVLAEADIVV